LSGKPASLKFSTRTFALESQISKLLCCLTGLEQPVFATSLSPFPSATHAKDSLSQERTDALNTPIIGIKMQAVGMNQTLDRHPASKRANCSKVLMQKIVIFR
jgi:hypothetical protein